MKAGEWAMLALALVPPASLRADDSDEWNCEHPGSSMEVDMCMSAELERADAALDAVYVEAVRRLREGQGDGCRLCIEASETLERAQRQWNYFRDIDCSVMLAANADGSGRSEAEMDCLIEHARFREQRLRRQYLD